MIKESRFRTTFVFMEQVGPPLISCSGVAGVLAFLLVACAHAPVYMQPAPVSPALGQTAQSVRLHGGTTKYCEREISFDFDQATLNRPVIIKLDESAELLLKYPDLVVEVSGHAELWEHYGRQLSLRRAQAAYDYFISKGVKASRMRGPVGYGSSRPIYEVDNPEDRASCANRRVDVNVQN